MSVWIFVSIRKYSLLIVCGALQDMWNPHAIRTDLSIRVHQVKIGQIDCEVNSEGNECGFKSVLVSCLLVLTADSLLAWLELCFQESDYPAVFKLYFPALRYCPVMLYNYYCYFEFWMHLILALFKNYLLLTKHFLFFILLKTAKQVLK